MRCNKAQEYLGLDLDGVLPPDATVQLTSHLDGCSECREFREDLLMGQRVLKATEPELPENFDWKLQLRLNQRSGLEQHLNSHFQRYKYVSFSHYYTPDLS